MHAKNDKGASELVCRHHNPKKKLSEDQRSALEVTREVVSHECMCAHGPMRNESAMFEPIGTEVICCVDGVARRR